MGKLDAFVEVLAKGLLASYLLLFAFEIHQKPTKFLPLLAGNLQTYANLFGLQFQQGAFVQKYIHNYSQAMVLMSLAVLCGTRFGKTVGWIVILLNLLLTWSWTELFYTGIHLMFVAAVL